MKWNRIAVVGLVSELILLLSAGCEMTVWQAGMAGGKGKDEEEDVDLECCSEWVRVSVKNAKEVFSCDGLLG